MRVALAFVLAVGIAQTAAAQNMSWSTITPSITGVDPLGQVLREQREAAGAVAPRSPTPSMVSTLYTPSKARRAANLQQFVARTRTVDPAGADALAKVFAEGDFIERIGAVVAPQGLRTDDLADAYAVYWINAWMAAQGRTDETSPATIVAVRDQAKRALVGAPMLTGANDAMKQQLAESLWVQAAMIETTVQQAKDQPALMAEVGRYVTRGARGMGLDLAAMTLTERGFEPVRR